MLDLLHRKTPRARRQAAAALYSEMARRSRVPRLYLEFLVPDTLDGRFDALALHVALLLARLRGKGRAAEALASELSGQFAADMDRTVREMGVGDLSVGKHVKRMTSAMLGRFNAYEAALESGAAEAALAEALGRNVWRGEVPDAAAPEALAGYVRELWAALQAAPLDDFLAAHESGVCHGI